MNKTLVLVCFALIGLGAWAEVPTLTVNTSSGAESMAVSTIRKIYYNGETMVVQTSSAEKSYAVSKVTNITLQNMPEATALEPVQQTPSADGTRKILRNGVLYIQQGSKLYTLTGEEVRL